MLFFPCTLSIKIILKLYMQLTFLSCSRQKFKRIGAYLIFPTLVTGETSLNIVLSFDVIVT